MLMMAKTAMLMVGGRVVPPLSYVGAAGANADNVTLPSHQAGDLIIIMAGNRGPGTPSPSLASGYTSLDAFANFVHYSERIGYKYAASSSETSGSWSNATDVLALVYRGIKTGGPFGAGYVRSVITGVIPSIDYNGITLDKTDNSSWVLCLLACYAGGPTTPPTGTTFRSQIANPTDGRIAAFDTNGGVTSWSTHTVTGSTTEPFTYSIELLQAV